MQAFDKHQASVTNTHALLDHFSPYFSPGNTSGLLNTKEGSNWFAMFNLNLKVKRVLDINLVHSLMHER